MYFSVSSEMYFNFYFLFIFLLIFIGSNNPNGSSSNNPEFLKAVDEIDRYMKQMESDNGPMGSKDVAELQLHYAKKMRQVSYKFILSFVYVVLNILYYGFNFFSYH